MRQLPNFTITSTVEKRTKNLNKHIVKEIIIGYDIFKFNGGELNIKLDTNIIDFESIVIYGNIKSNDNIMELLLLNDAIHRHFNFKNTHLVIPYVMYSRQDRVCNPGEALSVKVFANLINSMNFDSVETWDNHSDVATALINNCNNIDVHDLIDPHILAEYDYIIAPDAGANKKIQKISTKYNIEMIRADKIRDTETGDILETKVFASRIKLGMKKILIIDDICDGGRTFLELAKVLKSMDVDEIELYVTHGIFANGLHDMHAAGIDKFYTKNKFYNLSPLDDKLLETI